MPLEQPLPEVPWLAQPCFPQHKALAWVSALAKGACSFLLMMASNNYGSTDPQTTKPLFLVLQIW